MRARGLYTLIVVLAVANNAFAQNTNAAKDTVIKNATIDVIQSYKPQVKQPPKPEFIPSLPPTDTTHTVFNYDVPQQTLFYTYNSLPLRPLALPGDTVASIFPNYVKLGGGNLSTVYLDAGIAAFKGKNYETAIHLHHLSQQGNIQYQQSAQTGLEADGTLHTTNNVWHGNISAERNQYNYYGYDHSLYEVSSDSVRQVFTTLHASADMQSNNHGRLAYHPDVMASLYTDKHNATETSVGINIPFTYSIDTSLQLVAGLNGTFTQFKNPVSSIDNNILQLTLGISYHTNAFNLHALLVPTVGQDNSYLLPNIGVGYKVPNSQFMISAGWDASLRRNTYEEMSSENPYMMNVYQVLQTRTDEVYGNLQTNLGNHFTFNARVSWWNYNELPLFLNDMGDRKQFYVVYDDKLNAVSFSGGLRYQASNVFAAGITGSYYSYSNGTYDHPWHVPGIRVKGDLLFRPIPQLTVTAYVTGLDDIYALDANHQSVKLKSIMDIGGNAEYSFIPRLSVFLQVTNLLNNKYERWYGYEAYGLNIYGGLRLKF